MLIYFDIYGIKRPHDYSDYGECNENPHFHLHPPFNLGLLSLKLVWDTHNLTLSLVIS